MPLPSQAIHALDTGEMYQAYELYLTAHLYNAAHDIAVLALAPDAIIRKDLELLKNIFEPFKTKRIDNWNLRGKVCNHNSYSWISYSQLIKTEYRLSWTTHIS